MKTKNKKSVAGEITAEIGLMKNRVLEVISELSVSGDYTVNDIVERYHSLCGRAEKSYIAGVYETEDRRKAENEEKKDCCRIRKYDAIS